MGAAETLTAAALLSFTQIGAGAWTNGTSEGLSLSAGWRAVDTAPYQHAIGYHSRLQVGRHRTGLLAVNRGELQLLLIGLRTASPTRGEHWEFTIPGKWVHTVAAGGDRLRWEVEVPLGLYLIDAANTDLDYGGFEGYVGIEAGGGVRGIWSVAPGMALVGTLSVEGRTRKDMTDLLRGPGRHELWADLRLGAELGQGKRRLQIAAWCQPWGQLNRFVIASSPLRRSEVQVGLQIRHRWLGRTRAEASS